MGQITVIKRDGTKINLIRTEPFCTVTNAVQNFTLMGDDNVQLTIRSSEMMDFGIGDKILVGGDEYSVRTKSTREIIGENKYTYEVAFYGVMYELIKSLYRNTDANGKSSKTTFDLTYTLADFVKVIIYNVSRDYPGLWQFDAGNCPDTEPITFQFSKQNCLQVLQNVCKEFGYEFRIDQVIGVRIIRIGKFGAVVTPPSGRYFFEWGKGAGLYKLKEQKVDDKSVITRLWVEGGTRNIRSGYREFSDRLQLPLRRLNNHKHILADGTVIPAKSEYIGISSEDKRYLEDVDLKNKLGSIEDVEQLDEIYPKRTGKITALGADVYSFVDDTMDFDLTEKDAEGTRWIINGNTAKITIITGRLAGQEFELKETGGYVHSTRTFSIIKYTDERGLSTPSEDNEAFRFQVGDKYKITDINLPDSYVNDAEEDLWYAGYDKFLDRKQIRAQYVLTFDRSYFINSLPDDSETSIFRVGDYVPVKDERFNLEKNIRIQKLSRNLLLEHDYTLTISDITTVSVQSQIVQDVLEHNQIIETNRLKDINKARRGWRTTEELRNMVYDTDGYFDAENIKPNSIDTNMLTVGSKSQQFILVDVVLEANVTGLSNRFDATAGNLVHLTIDGKQARVWNMAAVSVTLAESNGYYVFAKCSKGGSSGVFYITQQQLKVENVEDPNNYYFQVGIIGSLHTDDNFRDFVSTYGFTRINGNTITTGKIITSDGKCYLDLDGNTFRIGDVNSSISWANGKLILKGTLIQNKEGDTSDLAVYRGTYNATYVYYRGDEVNYTNGSETCTYRYTNPIPGKGKNPQDSVYWSVVAKGEPGKDGTDGSNGNDGVDGKGIEFIFKRQNSATAPAKPTSVNADDNVPNGWTDDQQGVIASAQYEFVSKRVKSGGTWGMYSNPALWAKYSFDGTDGLDGKDGTDYEFIFTRTSSNSLPNTPATSQVNDYVPSGWTDNAVGVTSTYQYEWTSKRSKTNGVWGNFSTPALWSKYAFDGSNGNDGVDGKRYEIICPISNFVINSLGNWVVPVATAQFTKDGILDKNGEKLYCGVTFTQNHDGTITQQYTILVWRGCSNSDMQVVPAVGYENFSILFFEGSSTLYKFVEGEVYTLADLEAKIGFKIAKTYPLGILSDGADGAPGASVVFRGTYNSSDVYYGNATRVDAVKYNNVYYIASIDAGSFTNKVPTDTSKWNDFGAQFDSVATNLLLAENANIGDWYMSGGKITSMLSDGNKITLDASMARILVESNRSGDWGMSGSGCQIEIDANNGTVEARSKNSSYDVAYLSSSGVFCNNADTNAIPSSSGYTHRGAIVGLGFANVNKSDLGMNANETVVAGIYGRASNSGTAPAYGGFFYGLFAGGLTLGKKSIGTSDITTYLNDNDTMIIGHTSSIGTVYLPSTAKEGTVIFVKQWWNGVMRFRPRSGQFIYDDTSVNDYYDFGEGQGGMLVFTIGYITSGGTTTKKESWLVSRWKY